MLDVNRLLTQGSLRPGVRSTQWWTLARDAAIQSSIETVATVDGLTLCYPLQAVWKAISKITATPPPHVDSMQLRRSTAIFYLSRNRE